MKFYGFSQTYPEKQATRSREGIAKDYPINRYTNGPWSAVKAAREAFGDTGNIGLCWKERKRSRKYSPRPITPFVARTLMTTVLSWPLDRTRLDISQSNLAFRRDELTKLGELLGDPFTSLNDLEKLQYAYADVPDSEDRAITRVDHDIAALVYYASHALAMWSAHAILPAPKQAWVNYAGSSFEGRVVWYPVPLLRAFIACIADLASTDPGQVPTYDQCVASIERAVDTKLKQIMGPEPSEEQEPPIPKYKKGRPIVGQTQIAAVSS